MTPMLPVRLSRASALLALPFALLAIWLSGGVQIGSGNHAGLLPVVQRLIDPGYLPDDFGVGLRLYHHRVFAELLAAMVRVFGEAGGFALLTVLGMSGLMLALWRLARAGGLDARGYALLAALLSTSALFVGRGLEVNDFLGNGPIMPPTFSHAAVLMSLVAVLERRPVAALAWCGITGLFHLQIGAVWLCVLLPLLALDRPRPTGRQWALGLVLLVLGALPAFSHLWRLATEGLVAGGHTLDDVNFRMPHHFALRGARHALWPLAYLILLGVLAQRLRAAGEAAAARVYGLLFACCGLLGVFALLHFADYHFHLVPAGRLARLQFIRLSPLVTVLGATGLIFAVQRWLAGRQPQAAAAVFAALAVLVLLPKIYGEWRGHGLDRAGIVWFGEADPQWLDVCLWARAHTPAEARFLTPPGHSGFVSMAQRSTVAEHKVNPDGGRGLAQWYERLQALTGDQSLPRLNDFSRNSTALDEAYARNDAARLRELGRRYGARYVILLPGMPAPGLVRYENPRFRLAEIDTSSP
ncbi:DUF6798 domain-containing protein [Plasticicumulans sp.]|uniref:DUF6798 domain-containing protein n=1 Tax=Plasticicumulans sp. TaxID=2307179 RepID=UPI00393A1BFF